MPIALCTSQMPHTNRPSAQYKFPTPGTNSIKFATLVRMNCQPPSHPPNSIYAAPDSDADAGTHPNSLIDSLLSPY
eukprot:1303395-Rhodomonas_salina.1